MYRPKQIVFAPTTRCNLNCGHCRVDRGRTGLSASEATDFLQRCQTHDIDRVGFSGGEPFLEPAFLEQVCQAAVEAGFYFDRLMTNGVWFESDAELQSTLQRVYDAGFDGTLAISVDAWHSPDQAKLLRFVQNSREIWGRSDCLELVGVLNADGSCPRDCYERLASGLQATLREEGGIPIAISDQRYEHNLRNGMEDGSGLYIPILLLPYSPPAGDPQAWQARRWFTDDFCEGPGQIFYVHADGSVAVCCGFANERPQLVIGTVRDSYETLMQNAAANPHVKACYEQGLGKKREELEAAGVRLPGRTNDICVFCDWLCGRETGRG